MEYLKRKGIQNAVHHVLADICLQATEILCNEDEQENENDDDPSGIYNQIIEENINTGDPTDNGDNLSPQIQFVETEIHATTVIKKNELRFEGACLDIGAELIVIGKEQKEIYTSEVGKSIPYKKSN